MAEQHCLYPNRESVLVAYLYDDDIAAVDRVAFDTHLAMCERCRTDLADFRQVRSNLGQWATPESEGARKSAVHVEPRWWQQVPVWAQVAAAMLVLGVSASIANLDVRYDRANGLSVRTGWSKPAVAPVANVANVSNANATPWRADLAAMREDLRKEMRTQTPAIPVAAMSDAEFQRRVLPLLTESEEKQKTLFAKQLVQLQTDVYAQEQSNLSTVYKLIGVNTRAVAANRQQVNMLLSPR